METKKQKTKIQVEQNSHEPEQDEVEEKIQQSSNIDDIFEEIDKQRQEFDNEVEQQKIKGMNQVVLIGNTGCGKSTLTNLLGGVELKSRKKEGLLVYDCDKPKAKIGHKNLSETKVPNILVIEGIDKKEFVVIDCAGTNDTQENQEIINAYTLQFVFKEQRIQILFVLEESTLTENKCTNFLKQLIEFSKFLINPSKFFDSLIVIFNKCTKFTEVQDIKSKIASVYNDYKNFLENKGSEKHYQCLKIIEHLQSQNSKIVLIQTPSAENQTLGEDKKEEIFKFINKSSFSHITKINLQLTSKAQTKTEEKGKKNKEEMEVIIKDIKEQFNLMMENQYQTLRQCQNIDLDEIKAFNNQQQDLKNRIDSIKQAKRQNLTLFVEQIKVQFNIQNNKFIQTDQLQKLKDLERQYNCLVTVNDKLKEEELFKYFKKILKEIEQKKIDSYKEMTLFLSDIQISKSKSQVEQIFSQLYQKYNSILKECKKNNNFEQVYTHAKKLNELNQYIQNSDIPTIIQKLNTESVMFGLQSENIKELNEFYNRAFEINQETCMNLQQNALTQFNEAFLDLDKDFNEKLNKYCSSMIEKIQEQLISYGKGIIGRIFNQLEIDFSQKAKFEEQAFQLNLILGYLLNKLKEQNISTDLLKSKKVNYQLYKKYIDYLQINSNNQNDEAKQNLAQYFNNLFNNSKFQLNQNESYLYFTDYLIENIRKYIQKLEQIIQEIELNIIKGMLNDENIQFLEFQQFLMQLTQKLSQKQILEVIVTFSEAQVQVKEENQMNNDLTTTKEDLFFQDKINNILQSLKNKELYINYSINQQKRNDKNYEILSQVGKEHFEQQLTILWNNNIEVIKQTLLEHEEKCSINEFNQYLSQFLVNLQQLCSELKTQGAYFSQVQKDFQIIFDLQKNLTNYEELKIDTFCQNLNQMIKNTILNKKFSKKYSTTKLFKTFNIQNKQLKLQEESKNLIKKIIKFIKHEETQINQNITYFYQKLKDSTNFNSQHNTQSLRNSFKSEYSDELFQSVLKDARISIKKIYSEHLIELQSLVKLYHTKNSRLEVNLIEKEQLLQIKCYYFNLSKLQQIVTKQQSQIKYVQIYCYDTLIIDQETLKFDYNLLIQCLNLKISTTNEKGIVTLDFSAPVQSIQQEVIKNEIGLDGINGEDGEDGYNLFIKYKKCANLDRLVVISKGNDGGKGQDGKIGNPGKNATEQQFCFNKESDLPKEIMKKSKQIREVGLFSSSEFQIYKIEGNKGSQGSKGGKGGYGGKNGVHGNIQVINFSNSEGIVQKTLLNGKVGENGKPGAGGSGGLNNPDFLIAQNEKTKKFILNDQFEEYNLQPLFLREKTKLGKQEQQEQQQFAKAGEYGDIRENVEVRSVEKNKYLQRMKLHESNLQQEYDQEIEKTLLKKGFKSLFQKESIFAKDEVPEEQEQTN